MHALILAAGCGNRLAGASRDLPKCLLAFGGKTLLQRHIEALARHGITGVTLITGYRSGEIHDALQNLPAHGLTINLVQNDDYREGSVISLWTGRQALDSGEDVLLMDADVLYADSIIRALVNSQARNCFLLDRDFEPGDEPVKLCIRAGRIVEFRKILDNDLAFDLMGESVGFFRFSPQACRLISERAECYVNDDRRDQPYEEVLRDVVLMHGDKFGFEDITGCPWIEIDFPCDIERANSEILPAIGGARTAE